MSWANKYISVPFADKGRTIDGCDCWGLVRLIYKNELGVELPTLLTYSNTKDRQTIESLYQETKNKWKVVDKSQEKEYDVVVLNMMGYPTHVGVIIRKGLMIHCETGRGTTIVEYNSSQGQWFRNIKGFYRYDFTNESATI